MPVCPFSVVTSTNRNATSVIGFCRPVSTLASLIGVASGSVIEESFRWAIRSSGGDAGRGGEQRGVLRPTGRWSGRERRSWWRSW